MTTEQDRLAAELEMLAMQRAALLWDCPLIGNADVPAALGLAQTAWQLLKLTGEAPPSIRLGRRRYYRTADLRRWIESLETNKNAGEDAGVSEEEQGD